MSLGLLCTDRNCIQRGTFYFYIDLIYSYVSKEVESVILLIHESFKHKYLCWSWSKDSVFFISPLSSCWVRASRNNVFYLLFWNVFSFSFCLHRNQNPSSENLVDSMMSFPGMDNACLDKQDNPYVITSHMPAVFFLSSPWKCWSFQKHLVILCSALSPTCSVFTFHSLSFSSCRLSHPVSFY